MAANQPIRVVQISDLHLPDVAGQAGFIAPDADASLHAVLEEVRKHAGLDVVVASGDLADTGGTPAYLRLAEMLEQLPAPVYCIAGNHDRPAALDANLPRDNIHIAASTRLGNWLFLFLDSNAYGQQLGDDGVWRDRPDRITAAERGGVVPAEEHRARSILAETSADHVLVWIHHPPIAPPGAKPPDTDYVDQIERLVRDFPHVRGIACGHRHMGYSGALGSCPVYAAPSTAYNIDTSARTFDAPGYRWLELCPDGRIESGVRLLTEEFPNERSRPLPPVLAELMLGLVSIEELRAMSDDQFEARYGMPRPKR